LYQTFLLSKSFAEGTKKIESYIVNNLGKIPDDTDIPSFVKNWKSKWLQCHRIRRTFEAKHKDWLDVSVIKNASPTVEVPRVVGKKSVKDFDSLSNSQKRRRTSNMNYILFVFLLNIVSCLN